MRSPPAPGRCCPPTQRFSFFPTPMKMQGKLGWYTLVMGSLKDAEADAWLYVCSGLVCHVPDIGCQYYGYLTD